MAEKFDVCKALDLTPTAIGKSMSVVGKGVIGLAVVVGFGLLSWSGYITFIRPHLIKPTPTTSQLGNITNNYINPTAENIENIVSNQTDKRVAKLKKKRYFGLFINDLDIGITK